MNESRIHLAGFGGAGESIERVLDALDFQTAILTLNAAIEAAHAGEPGRASSALTYQARDSEDHSVGPAFEGPTSNL